jgi:cholesterol oxidase
MADHATDGVVDHTGAVFTGREDDELHRGLYVCDASTIPGALGTNPLFTIAALAERSAAFLTRERTV